MKKLLDCLGMEMTIKRSLISGNRFIKTKQLLNKKLVIK
jgi:hypothetical protein